MSWRACSGGFCCGCLFFSQMVLVFVGKVVYPLGELVLVCLYHIFLLPKYDIFF